LAFVLIFFSLNSLVNLFSSFIFSKNPIKARIYNGTAIVFDLMLKFPILKKFMPLTDIPNKKANIITTVAIIYKIDGLFLIFL